MKRKHLLCTVLAVVAACLFAVGLVPRTKQEAAAFEMAPVLSVNFDGNDFSADRSGWSVFTDGNGISASDFAESGYAFGDTTSFLTIAAPEDEAITTDLEGLTIVFEQAYSQVATAVNEVLFAVETENGSAYIRMGKATYVTPAGTATDVAPKGSMTKIMLNPTRKKITITVSADANEILVYVDGSLAQTYSATAEATEVEEGEEEGDVSAISKIAGVFLSAARAQGGTMFVRKNPEGQTNGNTEKLKMAGLKFYDACLNEDQVAALQLDGINAGDYDFNEKIGINYSNGAFSSSNANYEVTVSGTGIKSDSSIDGGYKFTDTSSHLIVTAKNDNAISNSGALTVVYRHKASSLVDYYYREHIVGVTDGTLNAVVSNGLLYGFTSKGALNTVVPAGAQNAVKTTEEKLVTITIDPSSGTIALYVNGKLGNYYNPSSGSPVTVGNAVSLFESELKKQNGTLQIRMPHVSSSTYNKKVTSMADFKIFDRAFTATEVLEYYKELTDTEGGADEPIGPDQPASQVSVSYTVDGLAADLTTQTSYGTGVALLPEEGHETAFGFTDTTSYIAIKANEGSTLTKNGKGISFHFMQRTNTETYYSGNSSLRPDVTDDFEQIIGVAGDGGLSAHVNAGSLYYYDGSARTYSQPKGLSGYKALLHTNWKAVSIIINAEDLSVSVYVDYQLKTNYNQTYEKKDVIANVVDLFTAEASKDGGTVYIRKPLRESRNSATMIFDDFIIGEGGLTEDEDRLYGLTRVKIYSDSTDSVPDLLGATGSVIPIIDSPLAGYELTGYYTDENYLEPLAENACFSPETTVLYAKFKPIKYTITYHTDGGIQNADNPAFYTVESDGVDILPIEKPGYDFLGWYRTEKFENEVSYLVPTSMGNIDLYAKFDLATYTVKYVLNDGLPTADLITTYTIYSLPALPDCWKYGYTFNGWFTDEALTKRFNAFGEGTYGNMTLYAGFTAQEFNIGYVLNGGTLDGYAPVKYNVDSEITLPSASRKDHLFIGWYSDAKFTEKVEEIDVFGMENVILYARFDAVRYTITYDADGGTLPENAQQYYTAGGSVSFVAAEKEGYAFIGWYYDKALTQKITRFDTELRVNVTFYAKFAKIYAINYVLNGGTLSASAPQSFYEGGYISLAPAAKEGFTFDGWYADEALTEKVESFDSSAKEDVTLYAGFTEEEHVEPEQPDSSSPDKSEEAKPSSSAKEEKGSGCGGTITLTPILTLLLALGAAAMVLLRKKEQI